MTETKICYKDAELKINFFLVIFFNVWSLKDSQNFKNQGMIIRKKYYKEKMLYD